MKTPIVACVAAALVIAIPSLVNAGRPKAGPAKSAPTKSAGDAGGAARRPGDDSERRRDRRDNPVVKARGAAGEEVRKFRPHIHRRPCLCHDEALRGFVGEMRIGVASEGGAFGARASCTVRLASAETGETALEKCASYQVVPQ